MRAGTQTVEFSSFMADNEQFPQPEPTQFPPIGEPQDLLILTEDSLVEREAPPRRPFVLRWHLPALLFVATGASTLWIGGWVYSLCVMTILLCHEFGHYVQTRRYGVRASLPFFIPMPLPPFGTMGAVILMDPRTGDRKALFDIGITGPLAGLIPTLIFCVVGLQHSYPGFPTPGAWEFGEPLVFKVLAHLFAKPVLPGQELVLGPMAMAGWVGLFITALNLFPIGQLDGGHILYGLLRRRARTVATTLLFAAIGAVIYYQMVWWFFMIFLLVLMGPAHPPTTDDSVPLGRWRTILGWLTLAFLPLGFTPNPLPEPRPVQRRYEPIEDRDLVWQGLGIRDLALGARDEGFGGERVKSDTCEVEVAERAPTFLIPNPQSLIPTPQSTFLPHVLC
jgi:Zn-dependent protease